MPDELVLDASVAAKLFIAEAGSDAAAALVATAARFIAPDLVLVELANVAVKRLRSREITREVAERIIASSRSIFRELEPAANLTTRAFELASGYGISVYDAMYVALAEQRGCDLVTADAQLISRAARANLRIAVRKL
jgi:predicted nucleic acid-binding protein